MSVEGSRCEAAFFCKKYVADRFLTSDFYYICNLFIK